MMVNVKALADLYRHMEWADAAVWTSVLASEEARRDAKLRDYLYHLHLVQRAFLSVWRGEWREGAYPKFDDARSLMEWGRTFYGEAWSHVGALGDEELAKPFSMPWASLVMEQIGREPETTTVGETALQVTLHTQYHRGQVNARLREAGGEPPSVDYIVWVWLGRPQPSWPSDES
jgi:uncharacterized damage-inducible protein DinB